MASRTFTVTGIPLELFDWLEEEAKTKGVAISSLIKIILSEAKETKRG